LETIVQGVAAEKRLEDAQILRENLKDIRGETDRIVANTKRVGLWGGEGKDVNMSFILVTSLIPSWHQFVLWSWLAGYIVVTHD